MPVAVVRFQLAPTLIQFVSYRNAQKIIARDTAVLQAFSKTSEIAQFNKMFISKILLNKKQVTFEERLALENSVRKLNDVDILNQWNKFVESGSSVTAQDEVKKLLAVLMEKISK